MSTLGKITRTTIDEDEDVVLVDVTVSPNQKYARIPFRTPGSGFWIVPEVGDIVELDEVDDRQVISHSPLFSGESLPSGLSEGDVSISLADGVELSLRKADDGTYNIEIHTDGELSLKANDILVGEEGNAKPVLTEDAVFEYEQRVDTGDGSGGTTTQETTTVSNNEVTESEVE